MDLILDYHALEMITIKGKYSLINPTPRNDAPELADLPNSTTLLPFTIALRFLPAQTKLL